MWAVRAMHANIIGTGPVVAGHGQMLMHGHLPMFSWKVVGWHCLKEVEFCSAMKLPRGLDKSGSVWNR